MILSKVPKVFVYGEKIDMRFSFERLSHFVRIEMGKNLSEGDLFLFFGKNRKRLKAIIHDGSGLVLLTKRMEKHNFINLFDLQKRELTAEELRLILHGSIIREYVPDGEMRI